MSDVLDTAAAGPAVIRGGAMRVLGYVAGIGLSVGSSALLLRHLGPVSFARYLPVVALVTLAGGITDAGLSSIGVRELSTLAPGAGRRLFRSLLGVRVLLSALGVLVALVFSLLAYPKVMVLGTLIAGAGVLMQTIQDSYVIPLQAELRFGWATAVDLVRQLITTAMIVTLVLVGAPLLPFWAAAAAGGLGAAVAAGLLARRRVPLLPSFERAVWGPLLRETLPYALAAAVGAVYYRVALLVVSLVANSHQTGYFGASFRITEVLIVVPQLLVGASFPVIARAARDDLERFDYAIGRLLDVSLLAGLAVCLGLLTGAHFIISVVAGPKYGPSVQVLQIQAVALVGSFIASVFGYCLLALRRYRATLAVNVSVLLLSAALTAILASSHGAQGAAAAVLIAELLYALLLGVAVMRAGPRPHLNVAAVPRVLAAFGLGCLALVPSGLPNVVRPLLAMAVFAAVVIALRALPEEIIEQLAGLRRRGP